MNGLVCVRLQYSGTTKSRGSEYNSGPGMRPCGFLAVNEPVVRAVMDSFSRSRVAYRKEAGTKSSKRINLSTLVMVEYYESKS